MGVEHAEVDKVFINVPACLSLCLYPSVCLQDLSITQQLDAGIRFLDIRMMLEYTDEPPQWWSLHMMQSNGLSVQYFREIRAWMDQHPSEVVVMWLSKHGNECATGQDQVCMCVLMLNCLIPLKSLFFTLC